MYKAGSKALLIVLELHTRKATFDKPHFFIFHFEWTCILWVTADRGKSLRAETEESNINEDNNSNTKCGNHRLALQLRETTLDNPQL